MPYSERFRLVHVAIPKTGTTSVVRALRQLHARHGGELTLHDEPIDTAFRRRHGLDALGDPQPGHAKHLSALQLATILGDRYREALSFTFVRNPWARAVSRWAFHHAENKPSLLSRLRRRTSRRFHRLDFADWVRRRVRQAEREGGARNQVDKLVDLEGRNLVELVGRLERVDEGFAEVCRRVGVEPIPVPHVNGTGGGRRYTELYDDWSRAAIADLYRRDVETFGYELGR